MHITWLLHQISCFALSAGTHSGRKEWSSESSLHALWGSSRNRSSATHLVWPGPNRGQAGAYQVVLYQFRHLQSWSSFSVFKQAGKCLNTVYLGLCCFWLDLEMVTVYLLWVKYWQHGSLNIISSLLYTAFEMNMRVPYHGHCTQMRSHAVLWWLIVTVDVMSLCWCNATLNISRYSSSNRYDPITPILTLVPIQWSTQQALIYLSKIVWGSTALLQPKSPDLTVYTHKILIQT